MTVFTGFPSPKPEESGSSPLKQSGYGLIIAKLMINELEGERSAFNLRCFSNFT
jgi:hypothetical protein